MERVTWAQLETEKGSTEFRSRSTDQNQRPEPTRDTSGSESDLNKPNKRYAGETGCRPLNKYAFTLKWNRKLSQSGSFHFLSTNEFLINDSNVKIFKPR